MEETQISTMDKAFTQQEIARKQGTELAIGDSEYEGRPGRRCQGDDRSRDCFLG